MIIKVKLAEVPVDLLLQLHATGLYGLTIEQTVEQLVLEGLRSRLHEGDVKLKVNPNRKRKGSR